MDTTYEYDIESIENSVAQNRVKVEVMERRQSGWIYFKVQSTRPISASEAKEVQINYGKAVMGYGFYSFKQDHNGDLYVTSWQCSASCD